jgi:hypothetical protein
VKCPNCGQDAPDGAAFCPYCAAPLQSGTIPGQPAPAPVYGAPFAPTRTSGMAIGGLVVGILAVVLSCLFWPVGAVLSLAGLILSILGLNEVKKQVGVQGKEMAIIGIVLSTLGLLLAILVLAGLTTLVLMGPRISEIFGQIYNSLP